MTKQCTTGCVLFAGAIIWAAPSVASACGGTFCDAGPQAMPVEQTGETVLFVLEDDAVETHVQISYDPETPAQRFAWVIPVMDVPEFAIGSQPLFDAVLTGTAPSYGFTTMREFCDSPDPDPCGDGGGIGEKFDVGSGSDEPPSPTVVEHRMVGAFEISVLDGGTAQGVFDWLDTEGFAPDPAATPILQEYLDEGFMFVALELATGAESDEVHPVVLRVPGTEPCVPIRLTRIATKDDLELRTLFFADGRVVPENYFHVVLNDLELDWVGQADNYRELVTLAVDDAGGRGFVTEYAGDLDPVDPSFIVPAFTDADVFRTSGWIGAMYILLQHELITCTLGVDLDECQFAHPLVQSLLDRYVPLPEGISLVEFATCPECFGEAFDDAAWDGDAFAVAYRERIVEPGQHAADLLAQWPWLTRMYTTMSAHEMTLDPTFIINPDLPEDDNLNRIGQVSTFCDGTQSFDLPDGRLVALPNASAWPDIGGSDMPSAERIEMFGPAGAPIVQSDRRPVIDALLSQYNAEYGPVRPPGQHCHDTDSAESDSGGFDTYAFIDDPDGSASRDDDVVNCACDSGRSPTGAAAGLLLIATAGLGRRRRKV